MAIRVSDTTYFVSNIDDAINFYTQKLGFRVSEKFEWGFAYIEVDGKHRIGLMSTASWADDFPGDKDLRPRVSLQSNDFDADVKRLQAAGVKLGKVAGVKGKPRGVVVFDNDENPIFLWTDPKDGF
jgi:catechol 2,3-dioxygenase-like lactoylglutathione lyase family enzyme